MARTALLLLRVCTIFCSLSASSDTLLLSCSPLGSGTVQFKVAGEILVKPHEQPKTGYKAPNAYGAHPIFSDET